MFRSHFNECRGFIIIKYTSDPILLCCWEGSLSRKATDTQRLQDYKITKSFYCDRPKRCKLKKRISLLMLPKHVSQDQKHSLRPSLSFLLLTCIK